MREREGSGVRMRTRKKRRAPKNLRGISAPEEQLVAVREIVMQLRNDLAAVPS